MRSQLNGYRRARGKSPQPATHRRHGTPQDVALGAYAPSLWRTVEFLKRMFFQRKVGAA